MRYRSLGNIGLTVSEVGFGAWTIGGGGRAYGPTDDAESLAAIRRALELGITFFDTADIYGNGHSEELLGRVLSVPGIRERVLIATKAGYDFYRGDTGCGPTFYRGEVEKNFRPEHLMFAIEQSLRRLRTDRVELFQLHNPPVAVLRDSRTAETMEKLVAAGKARFWGVSVTDPDEARAAIAAGARSLQLVHNFLRQPVLPAIREDVSQKGIGVIVRTPLEYGLLSGKITLQARFPEGDHRRGRWSDAELAVLLERVEAWRRTLPPGRTLVQEALRFVITEPTVSVVIPGVRNARQAEEHAASSG